MSKNSREAMESAAGCDQKHLRCFANGASELLQSNKMSTIRHRRMVLILEDVEG